MPSITSHQSAIFSVRDDDERRCCWSAAATAARAPAVTAHGSVQRSNPISSRKKYKKNTSSASCCSQKNLFVGSRMREYIYEKGAFYTLKGQIVRLLKVFHLIQLLNFMWLESAAMLLNSLEHTHSGNEVQLGADMLNDWDHLSTGRESGFPRFCNLCCIYIYMCCCWHLLGRVRTYSRC